VLAETGQPGPFLQNRAPACSIWQNRGGGVVRACRSEGGKAQFCKIKCLRARSGKTEGRGEGETEVEGSCVQKRGQQAPPRCVKMKNTTARGRTPSCHVEMGRMQQGGACPSSLHIVVLLVWLVHKMERKYAGAPCTPAFSLSTAPPPLCCHCVGMLNLAELGSRVQK